MKITRKYDKNGRIIETELTHHNEGGMWKMSTPKQEETLKKEELGLDEYQEKCALTAIYSKNQKGHEIEYCTLGLVGEAGEIANKVKKVLRGDYTIEEICEDLGKEIFDVVWYCSMLATELGLSMDDLAHQNLAKLASRKARGVISGDGDNR